MVCLFRIFFIIISSTYHAFPILIACNTYNMISQNQILDLMALLKDLNSEITTKNKNKTQNPTSYDIE